MTALQTAILADSPIVFYEMAEASGTTATDSSGHSNNGVYTGTLGYHAAGPDTPTSYSLLTSGAGYLTPNSIISTYLDAGSPLDPWSFEIFLNPKSILVPQMAWGNAFVSSKLNGLTLLYDADGTHFQVGGAGAFTSVDGDTLNLGQWNHAVCTFDGSIMRLYLNNVVTAATAAQTYDQAGDTHSALLALAGYPSASGTLGVIGDELTATRAAYFSFYETCLTPARVTAHFDAMPQFTLSSGTMLADEIVNNLPAVFYRTNETSGTVAHDSSFLNANDGAYQGTVTLNQTAPEASSPDAEITLAGAGNIQAGAFLNPDGFTILTVVTGSAPGSLEPIVSNSDSGVNPYGMDLSCDANGAYFNVWGESGSQWTCQSVDPVTDGQAHLIIATFDGHLATLYIDGVAVDQDSHHAQNMVQTISGHQVVAPLVGKNQAGVFFSGSVYYYAQFTEALTPDEINALFGSLVLTGGLGGTDSVSGGSDTDETNSTGPTFGSAMIPGLTQKKYNVFIGLRDLFENISYIQRGVYLLGTTNTTISSGQVKTTGHAYDLTHRFGFDVYDDFPKTLYGNQNDIRYDSNYNLTNPSTDGVTWICDAKNFMLVDTDNTFFTADYDQLFGASSNNAGTDVYVGDATHPANTPVSPNDYTWYPGQGKVVFKHALTTLYPTLTAPYIISLDGVPLGMAPENMLKHLFIDKCGLLPQDLNFQVSNLVLPRYMGSYASGSAWQVAQNIAKMTAPRAVQWQIRVDNTGVIQFYEQKYGSTPVVTLEDERDLWSIEHTMTDDNIVNVVRATVEAYNQQQINSISYDIDSINEYGERAEDDVDSSLLLSAQGMTPTKALAFLNGYAASELAAKSRPIQELKITMAANPNLEIGDKVNIVETKTGISGPYIIKGITEKIAQGKYNFDMRLQKQRLQLNMGYGFPASVSEFNGQSDYTADQGGALATGQHAIIRGVQIGGVIVVQNGSQVYDAGGEPIVPVMTSLPFSLQLTIDTRRCDTTYLWRWLHFECFNTLDSSDLLVMRLDDWKLHDHRPISVSRINSGTPFTNTVSSMFARSVNAHCYKYSNIVIGIPPEDIPIYHNYEGISVQFKGDFSKKPTTLGVGFGAEFSSSNFGWCPSLKQTYGFWSIFAMNAAGALQILRVPLILEL